MSTRGAAAARGLWALLVTLAIGLVLVGSVWPSEADADVPPGAPTRLELSGVKRAIPVVPITVRGEVLDPPRNVRQVGWWRDSAQPGDEHGQTVITGHSVHTGGGSLNRLDRVQVDQQVVVVTKKARVSYQVDDVDVLTREQLARQSRRIFGQDHGDARLVLITCTDWNGTEYDKNIVVTAHRYAAAER